jgi:competence protein ComGF
MHWKNKAFTLLECLVALFVITGSVLVIQGLTRLARQDVLYMQDTQEKDWQSFCNQLRSELDGSTFRSADGNFLYVRKTEEWRFGRPAAAEDFRKSHANGQGYQPMLHGLKSASVSADRGLITIKISFLRGGERVFLYKFLETESPAVSALSSTSK